MALCFPSVQQITLAKWPASWSSGQSLWLLIMRSRLQPTHLCFCCLLLLFLKHVGYLPFTCRISCIAYNNWGYNWTGQAISYSGGIMRSLVGIYGDVSRALHPVPVSNYSRPAGYVYIYLLDSRCLLLHTLYIYIYITNLRCKLPSRRTKHTVSQPPHLYLTVCYLHPPCSITFRPPTHGVPRFPYTLEFWNKCPRSHWLKC